MTPQEREKAMQNLGKALIDLYLGGNEPVYWQDETVTWNAMQAKKAIIFVALVDDEDNVIKTIPATKATGRPARAGSVSATVSAPKCSTCGRPF